MIRPSSLPMLAVCPCFDGQGGEFAESGRLRHVYLESLLRREVSGDPKQDAIIEAAAKDLSEEEQDSVVWAFDYIKCHAPMSDYAIAFERKMHLLDENFERVFPEGGTPDVTCGPVLFDLKWRERDYTHQMAAYALMMLEEHDYPEVKVHVLYAEPRRVRQYSFTKESASALVFDILKKAQDPDRKPSPCDYCGWCSNAYKCEPLLQTAAGIAKRYCDLDRVKNWHPSQMETAEEINQALWVARKVVKKWLESIEHHALDAVQKRGLTLEEFGLVNQSGGTYVTDVPAVYASVGIPQGEFFKCVDIRMATSKKYPDKKGLVDIYAGLKGTKKAPAEREIKKKLSEAGLLKVKKPKIFLKAKKSTETETEGEE